MDRRLLWTLASLAVLGGCLDPQAPEPPEDAPRPSAQALAAPPLLDDVEVAGGLEGPTAMAFAPDGRLFICEQAGRLRVVRDGALLEEPFVVVDTEARGERGLLGVTFDPDFPATPYVYVYYTTRAPQVRNRLSRFRADGDRALAGSEQVLLEFTPPESTYHNGGGLLFGADGRLYLALGDSVYDSGAQSLEQLWGKVLRLERDGRIPEDNPFFHTATGAGRAIWALGLRNPFSLALQPGTGRLFINDVGATRWEEINEGAPGANYGWPQAEGPTGKAGLRAPRHAYRHGQGPEAGCAVTGGTFYEPPRPLLPARYQGRYVYADYCGGWIRALDVETGASEPLATGLGGVVDLDVGPDGALYYLSRWQRSVHRLQAASRPELEPLTGLRAEYHDGLDFTDLKLTRVDPQVDFHWLQGVAAPGLEADTFSVRWTGSVVPAHSETYTFYTQTNDGVRLWVDGQLLIDRWQVQRHTQESATLTLEAGRAYSLRLEYFDNKGWATARLLWSSPRQPKQVIPEAHLRPSAP